MAGRGGGGLKMWRLQQDALYVLLGSLMCVIGVWTENSSSDLSCTMVRYAYRDKGFNVGKVPKDPVSGEHLRVCPQGLTCCTEEMEHELSAQSRQEFDKVMKESLSKWSSLIKTRAQRFDEFFTDLLVESKKNFHEMFIRTYGVLYEQNSYVFTDFFEELERYHAKGQVDLEDAMENFFNTLYQKMFTVLNAQYRFDDRYLACVGEHMKELKPFGDVPHKLSVQVKRSFVATRTFIQALYIVHEVVTKVSTISPSPACIRAVTKMTHCPACQGLPELKACNNYCINVMKGCLAYHVELNSEWEQFLDALIDVSDRLLGPFNIETVVEPINIKISEAIMNYQENSNDISQKVFNGCGKPRLGRRDATELKFETLQFDRSKPSDHQGGPRINRLIKDIKQKMKLTRRFWAELPYQVCSNENVAASPVKEDSCWNGLKKARYEQDIIGDGINNQQNNPEVQVDVSRPSSLLNEQIFVLKTITNKLKNAYNGMDVEWIDYEESGYGSGGGSGDGDDTAGSGDGVGNDLSFEDTINSTHHPKVDQPPSTTGGGSGVTSQPSMSVTKAVMTYLIPVVVMWFGGIVTDFL